MILNFVVAAQLPSLNYNCCTNHIACSRYVKLESFVGLRGHKGGWDSQVPFEFFKCLMLFFGTLELILLF
jgi:hypothetical protein